MVDCIFCQIVSKDLPAKIVFETPSLLAFRDIHPQAPCHILVIPKKHIPTLNDLQPEDQDLMGELISALPKIAQSLGLQDYRLRCHIGKGGGQEVFHLHWHLLN